MRDWERYVRTHLRLSTLTSERESRIVQELASQFEDFHRDAVARGMTEADADAFARAQITDWTALASTLADVDGSHTRAPLDRWSERLDDRARQKKARFYMELLADLRYAIRLLRKTPAFTAAAIGTLALGIGANTAMFSIVNAVLLQPLPYPEPSRVFVVRPQLTTSFSAENFLDLQREARSFEALGAYAGNGFTLTDRGEPEFVMGQMISAELLDALDVQPLAGRPFRPDENEGGRDQVMLVSHGLWQRRYGGDPGIVGRTITANGKPYTVIGVMPPAFEFPQKRYELWVPFAFRNNPQGMVNRGTHFLQVVGRLHGGTSVAQAQAELDTIGSRLAQAYPDVNAGLTIRLTSLLDETVGNVRTALLLVLSAVGFVLLIACANVTNLLLARASTRQREIAVRTTLGASRARLVSQMLTETLVLYIAGASAGVVLAALGLDALIALSPGDIPRLAETTLDLTTLAFTLGLALATGIAFGLIPALHSTFRLPAEQLKAAARSATAGRASRRARATFVAAEVALSLMLMVGAALAARSLLLLERVDTGLDAKGVLTFYVVPPETTYPNGDSVRGFHREVIERLSAQPGAIAVGATSHLPLSGANVESRVTPEGWQPTSPNEGAGAGLRGVAGHFFEALGAHVTAGRAFTDADTATAPLVAMVNEEFARRYWPGQNAVGKRLKQGRIDSEDPWKVVVGVYADLKHQGPQADTRPEAMFPYAQMHDYWATRFMRGLFLVMRTTGDPMSLLPAARRVVRSVDPSVPLVEPRKMTTLVSDSVAQPRFRSTLLVSFAGLAMLLAIVGIYGVVRFNTEQRLHEISVRIALGAQRGSVVGLILRQESMPVLAGIVVGLAAAIAVGRAMRTLLFNVAPDDPVTFIATPVLLGAVALAACLIPARRALDVDPVNGLREQ